MEHRLTIFKLKNTEDAHLSLIKAQIKIKKWRNRPSKIRRISLINIVKYLCQQKLVNRILSFKLNHQEWYLSIKELDLICLRIRYLTNTVILTKINQNDNKKAHKFNHPNPHSRKNHSKNLHSHIATNQIQKCPKTPQSKNNRNRNKTQKYNETQ